MAAGAPKAGYPGDPDAWEISSRVYEERKRQEWAHAWADYHADQAARIQAVLSNLVDYHRRERQRYEGMLSIEPKGES